ncbi:MAG: response regulator transcription factor [Desulfobulbaceae bacterium]|uniref:Response regulator transcription factor n=1 Tax=Candidatus Desulfobia pelagia TaxID=2841692 RepID=A0A8J6TC76_9BACT|nr:response regulator transcription factor [Candidatus Desulfobia pelagia]
MIRILLADDHTIVREGLKQILAETSDIVATGEAANGLQVLNAVRKNRYDLVILDIAMPGRGGLDVLKDLNKEYPALPVLMLSMYPEEQYAVRALKAGASGYLTKESAADELIAAIHKVTQGGKYISGMLAEKLASYLGDSSEKAPHELLSDREYQVMLMIAAGKTVSDIADELSLSVKTISTNRSRALQKMGMKNNAEFTYYAIKESLVG